MNHAVSPEALARRFHDVYERLAPSYGYETRVETREFNASTPNGRLMIAVCAELLSRQPREAEQRLHAALDDLLVRVAKAGLIGSVSRELNQLAEAIGAVIDAAEPQEESCTLPTPKGEQFPVRIVEKESNPFFFSGGKTEPGEGPREEWCVCGHLVADHDFRPGGGGRCTGGSDNGGCLCRLSKTEAETGEGGEPRCLTCGEGFRANHALNEPSGSTRWYCRCGSFNCDEAGQRAGLWRKPSAGEGGERRAERKENK